MSKNELCTQATLRTLQKEIGKNDNYHVQGSRLIPKQHNNSLNDRRPLDGESQPRDRSNERSNRRGSSQPHGRSNRYDWNTQREIEDKTLTLPSLVTMNIVGVLVYRLFDLVSGTSAVGLN